MSGVHEYILSFYGLAINFHCVFIVIMELVIRLQGWTTLNWILLP